MKRNIQRHRRHCVNCDKCLDHPEKHCFKKWLGKKARCMLCKKIHAFNIICPDAIKAMQSKRKFMFSWNEILCKLGFHLWHKTRFDSGARVQCYAFKECERCGVRASGYSKRNHPFFRKVLGEHDRA